MSANMTRGVGLALVVLVGLATAAAAESLTGLAFLKAGVDAGSSLMGEAVVSHVADVSACYWNPAGLMALERASLMVSHTESFSDLRHEYGAVAQPVGRIVTGLFFNGVWSDDVEGYDSQANPTGAFGYATYAMGLAAGVPVTRSLDAGLTVKYLNESIANYSATGWAADLGIQWDAGQVLPSFAREGGPSLRLGAVLGNVGAPISFIDEEIELPLTIQGGATTTLPITSLDGRVLLAAEGRAVRDEDAALLLGAAYEYRRVVRFGLGYRTGHDTRDLSLGIGIHQGALAFHWAYVPIAENLGDEHRFTLGLGL